MKKRILVMFLFGLLTNNIVWAQNYEPIIQNVFVEQQTGTYLVDILYDVTDDNNDPLIIYVQVSDDSGKTFSVPAKTFTGDYGFDITPGLDKHIIWNAGLDYPEQYGERFRVKLTASDSPLGQAVSVLSGTFTMGSNTGLDDQQPEHEITLNEYRIATFCVTNEQFKIFCDMTDYLYPPEGGLNQPPAGYFLNNPDYPVVGISWYDAVRFCNWLSSQKGYSACYDTTNWTFDPSKNGYHLPSEAQWEKASRGNLDKKTYPWGDDPPGNRCNYKDYSGGLIDIMPNFDGTGRGTLPVGQFSANGLGLFDMAGNVWEWCNDWYQVDYYEQSPAENPYGPQTGSEKVMRGGAWNKSETYLECAFRDKKTPGTKRYDIGFRIAR